MSFIARRNIALGANLIAKRSLHASSTTMTKYRMPSALEHATGLEKAELMAIAAGNENPFDMRVFKRTSGEVSNPTVIPSHYPARLVGCICHEEATCVNWMWLSKGTPKRCECGYFFKLVDKEI